MSLHSRSRVVPALIALLAVAACDGGAQPEADSRPNILLIVVDTLRADHLSQYGYGLQTGVGLDSFTQDAHQFLNAYSVSPRTGPSTASLLTGLAPETHGVFNSRNPLPSSVDTLAERLSAAGWSTVGFSHNAVVGSRSGFGQGFESFTDYEGGVRAYPDVSELVQGATEWLATRDDRPFFMYLHAMNVHGPYETPESHSGDLLGRPPAQGFEFYGPLMKGVMRGGLANRARVTPEFLTSLQEQYDSAIRYTCDQLARVLERLREAGTYDETLVILTADHGEELFDHGGFGHAYTLHREVLHVPLFVKLPGQRSRRMQSSPTSLLDIHPTLLSLVGLDVPVGLHGRSLAQLLGGESGEEGLTDVDRSIYFQESSLRMAGRALLAGDLKLIEIDRDYEQRKDVRQLFDLRTDPEERHDLASERPEVVEQLARRLAERSRLYERTEDAPTEPVGEPIDEDLLRALGYAE